MQIEFLPQGTVTMQEVMITFGAVCSSIAAIYAWAVRQAQAAKDQQIKALQETINYLREELKNARNHV